MKYLLIGLTVAGILLGLAYLREWNRIRSYQHLAAVTGFIQVTELAPDDAGAYNKGIALSQLGRHEEAQGLHFITMSVGRRSRK